MTFPVVEVRAINYNHDPRFFFVVGRFLEGSELERMISGT